MIVNNTPIILIEGPDNVGKTSTIELIRSLMPNKQFQLLHYTKPPKTSKSTLEYQKDNFNNMMKLINNSLDSDIPLILDRAHLGEMVYGKIYRQTHADWIFDLEKEYDVVCNKVFLLTMIDDAESILKRDDNLSFYQNKEQVQAEIDGFIDAHERSNIKHKFIIDYTRFYKDENGYVDLTDVLKNIFRINL